MKNPSIGEMLRELRNQAGLSQADVAKALETDQTTVSRIERGLQAVDDARLLAFANALGLSIKQRKALQRSVVPLRLPPKPALDVDYVDVERERQSHVSAVWVVCDEPLELSDTRYREVVRDGIQNRQRRYTYWLSSREMFERLLAKLRLPEEVNDFLEAVQVPTPVTWHPGVLYEAQDPYNAQGYLLLESERPTGYVLRWHGHASFERTRRTLNAVHEELFVGGQREFSFGGAEWRRIWPPVPGAKE